MRHGILGDPSRSSARVTTMHVVSIVGGDRRHPPGSLGSRTSISPIREPAPRRQHRDPAARRTEPVATSISVSEASPRRISVSPARTDFVAAEQLVEQSRRQAREQLRLAEHPLVAAPVEQQRLALAVAGVLHVAEEERVVAAPVRAHDARDEMRQSPSTSGVSRTT